MFPFLELKGLNSYLKIKEIRSDHLIFRLHCIFTTVVLIAASMLLTTSQLVGKPIQCYTGEKNDNLEHVINDYCWVSTTFSMPDAFDKKVGGEVIYPGVGNGNNPNKKYHCYYQWVCFVLFFQALFCYLPKAIWEYQEGGLLEQLTTGLHGVCNTGNREQKKKSLVSYFLKYRKMHKSYAFIYWGCEVLCLVNVLVQMWMMDLFLGGQFWMYGTKVVNFSQRPQEERVDPMIFIFPRLTKCTFTSFGVSGSPQSLDAFCILPLNIINEKTYIFLWFWFIILAVVLAGVICSRLLVLITPSIRPRLLNARARSIAFTSADIVSRRSDVGDWWLLYLLAKNINPVVYRDMVADLAKEIAERERPYTMFKPTLGREKALLG